MRTALPNLGRPPGSKGIPALAVVLACLLMLRAVGAEADALADALDAAVRADAPLRNALGLYLRIAGIVWVGVEWFAAIMLWRCYRLLRRHAASRGIH